MQIKIKTTVIMRILIACERTQTVCKAFRLLGIDAFSCDLQECSGGHPEWHFKQDVFEVIDMGIWDAMIAFPPCTHLAVSGAAWFEAKRKDGRQQEGIDFFLKIANAPIPVIAIENPVGIMSKLYRKPDQIIQPYYFGDEASKKTCLWLKGLPPLYHNEKQNLFDSNITHVGKGEIITYESGNRMAKWYAELRNLPKEERSNERSKTFQGIANAMAIQWGGFLQTQCNAQR